VALLIMRESGSGTAPDSCQVLLVLVLKHCKNMKNGEFVNKAPRTVS
jgi:hypothetical protein